MNDLADLPSGFVQRRDDYLRQIDAAIISILEPYRSSRFYDPLLQAMHGGKRLRPLLLLFTANMNPRHSSDPMPAAVAIEFIHLESLIHDDILDHDSVRRAAPAFHIRHDMETAILSADFLLSLILKVVSLYNDANITSALSSATAKMCEGELGELKAIHVQQPLSQERYIQLVSQKTATLFEVAARLGAFISGAQNGDLEAITRYGRYVGIAYQIYDDIADSDAPITQLLQLPSSNPVSSRHRYTFLRKLAASYITLAQQEIEHFSAQYSSLLIDYSQLIQTQFQNIRP